MVEKFYTKTGMYIDWKQLESLPKIDTFIDIGVGTNGSKIFYRVFKKAKLIRLFIATNILLYKNNKIFQKIRIKS